MQVSDIKYHTPETWDEYAALHGVSFSSLKDFSGPPSPGMMLGTRCHNFILEPHLYDWQQATEVRAIATELNKWLPRPVLRKCKAEQSVTATFTHKGFSMPYKMKTDLLAPGLVAIDLKIIAGDLDAYIKQFGYDHQLEGYMLGTGSPLGLIIAYNKIKKLVQVRRILPNAEWWENIVLQKGEYNATV